ncbi:MAG: AarF/UbiB family protein, partial [Thermoanaerobaculia bacterium]|nr:AarF/UbiB family protein [Thermoanaerobaculia bacterium]
LADGTTVVVKVLRPEIESLVETDLKALGIAFSWLSVWGAVRRRIDLEWLEEEFATTTRRELDMRIEGKHAERFRDAFAGRGDVGIPEIHWPETSRRVLTQENVAYIKIADLEGLRAAGIQPKRVARRLYRLYMEQVFVHHFVHADPHPGNLFVRPLPRDPSILEEMKERTAVAAEAVGLEDGLPFDSGGTAFRIYFVDFGMMAEIPRRLRQALRKYIIGMANRDASAVVQAFRDSGSLLPGADLAQIEEAVEAIFDRFWGLDMSRINKMALDQATALWREFGQMLLETPIQVQVDLMFTGRAVEILSGLTKILDDEFNPWLETLPFAQRLAFEEWGDWKAQTSEFFRQARSLARLPDELARTVGLAQRGRLTVRTAMAPDLRRRLGRLETTFDRLGDTVLAGALLVAGAILHSEEPELGVWMMGGAGVVWFISRWARRG